MDVIATAVARAETAPERVWEMLIDGRRWREWSEATDWMLVEGALAPGSVVTIKRKRARQTAYRIEWVEPERRFALLLTFGPMARMRIAWTLEPVAGGTDIRQTIESGGPLRRWLSDPLARRNAARLSGDPAQLANLVTGVGTSVR